MSPDHLNEEGPAEPEEIEIPFNIILFFSILLIISYGTHFSRHFHLFGLLARILFWIYEFWTIIQDMLFYWYFLLCFNYYIRQKETSLDSTQSRDQQIDSKYSYKYQCQIQKSLGISDHKLTFHRIATLMKFLAL